MRRRYQSIVGKRLQFDFNCLLFKVGPVHSSITFASQTLQWHSCYYCLYHRRVLKQHNVGNSNAIERHYKRQCISNESGSQAIIRCGEDRGINDGKAGIHAIWSKALCFVRWNVIIVNLTRDCTLYSYYLLERKRCLPILDEYQTTCIFKYSAKVERA